MLRRTTLRTAEDYSNCFSNIYQTRTLSITVTITITKFAFYFFSVIGSLIAGLVVVHGMDLTTSTTAAPEATTEDASGRLLTLPNVEKCANRKLIVFFLGKDLLLNRRSLKRVVDKF